MPPKSSPTKLRKSASSSATARRNALRDFYKLSQQPVTTTTTIDAAGGNGTIDSTNSTVEDTTAVDISHLLQTTTSLRTLLRFENGLITEVRTLQNEKKSLVYNNYSKLIGCCNVLQKIKDIDVEPLESGLDLSEEITNGSLSPGAPRVTDVGRSNRAAMAWVQSSAIETVRKLVDDGDMDNAQKYASKTITLIQRWTSNAGAILMIDEKLITDLLHIRSEILKMAKEHHLNIDSP